jgi:H+-transporting ATPase
MKAHKNCTPEDAEVLRNGKWIRYDAASLVIGDVIRLEEGDIVPADCVIAIDHNDDEDLLVDLRAITGQSRPKQLNMNEISTQNHRTLLFGGTVVRGYGKALVTAIGTETVLGQLIKNGQFPVSEKDSNDEKETMIFNENTNMTAMEMGTIT